MAHFAEIDLNGKVLRVNCACNQDIANNGGEQSEQAAKHFETTSPLSENGVKWVQTSYNHNFRNNMLELDTHLIPQKTNSLIHNHLHLGHSMLMTTGKHPLHIQQLRPMEIM
jgi:hypothetical protein